MPINIDENNLKQGLLGVVVALIEIIQEVLERQALQRIERGILNDGEVERLGEALADLDQALKNIKKENDIEEAVRSVRDGLDQTSNEIIDKFLSPGRWAEEVGET